MKDIFKFKNFSIVQKDNAIKVNNDGILLGAWANCQDCQHLLDIGTGTGVIALLVAHKQPEAIIDAVEIDEMSCIEAQHNVSQSSAADRIQVIKKSIQDFAKDATVTYDHILCNPPFFSGGSLSSVPGDKDLLRQTTKLGHGDLLIAVSRLLRPGGKFSVILPFMEGLRFIEMAQRYHMILQQRVNVKKTQEAKIEKVLLTFMKEGSLENITETELITQNVDGSYTQEYETLLSSL